LAFDGVRKHLAQDFSKIYVFNLHGDIRKDSMRDGVPLGEQHTIFGLAAMVGISINILIKTNTEDSCKIFYADVDFRATRKEKLDLLDTAQSIANVEWKELEPDNKFTWLTEGLKADFEDFISIGNKETRSNKTAVSAIFKTYSLGVVTNRDRWAYNFDRQELEKNIKLHIETYNQEVFRWKQTPDKSVDIDNFILYDEARISSG